jgi:hypothetical protein
MLVYLYLFISIHVSQANIKDVKNKIGEWCRLSYELSQDDLAQALEMSRLTIETGRW